MINMLIIGRLKRSKEWNREHREGSWEGKKKKERKGEINLKL